MFFMVTSKLIPAHAMMATSSDLTSFPAQPIIIHNFYNNLEKFSISVFNLIHYPQITLLDIALQHTYVIAIAAKAQTTT